MSLLVKGSSLFPSVDDFFSNDLFDLNSRNIATLGTTLPAVNIEETDKEIMFDLAAPGMKKEDFEVELSNNILSISSEHEEKKEEKNKKGEFIRKEYSYKSFVRSFNLPEYANDSKIDATYKDGVLHVVVGKKEIGTTKKAKSIKIK